MINWVSRAWAGVSEDVVLHSFVTCRISSSPDGSQDEHLNERMARALNHNDQQAAVRDEAVDLLFDDESDGDQSEFSGFGDSD